MFGEADRGTLFLDELGEWSTETQAVPLRALDKGGEFKRIGESQARRADVRFIAATNKDRGAAPRPRLAARHRRDESPLRERREDIPLLVRHLLRLHATDCTPDELGRLFDEKGAGQHEPRVDLRMIEEILRLPLERNVRELSNLLWRAITTSRGKVVSMPPVAKPGEVKIALERGASPVLAALLPRPGRARSVEDRDNDNLRRRHAVIEQMLERGACRKIGYLRFVAGVTKAGESAYSQVVQILVP